MGKTVKAVCLNEPNHIEIKDVAYPEKQENEVLIKVEAMGICGSDIGAYRGTNPLVTYPRILGHEIIGTILEKGIGIPNEVEVGDRVVVDPYVYCGHCYPCSIGRTNCCESLKVIGVHINGGMQEVITHPAHMVVKINGNIPINYLPLAEPLTISLHALHRTNVTAGEHVVIIGAGAIGLMAALACIQYKAIPILVDILDQRLSYANQIGIAHTINPNNENAELKIKEITKGRMAEVIIEASGANISIRNALKYVSFAGRIALTGWPKMETPLPTNLITFKELNIYGSRTSKGEFEEALHLLETGKINAEKIVTKTINFNELPKYVQNLSEHPENYLKVNAIF
ncbi:hypothetical protein EDC44_10499 [Cricetibacter osteomyelitidis]|uniref:2-desacetyl-2-hydroxyethyl bacteriochlorophyllide A dehydrogenase n=1 Tax=Cricetibacter osteomyelitidis TaxID=1521931 RepID=A0A4R2T5B2_9PAST|nr:alcohol dehydrogenase catalytic domain-containing protein [Cricetibacter osteomyelitidis]TCP96566.1 hypothetical protein EDC44_10499 [Cricetibacter osteomyelitidis]